MTTRAANTGIPIVGSVPWGTHLCHFYETRQDLLEVLVPFFKAGLENNELCVWITAEPLSESEARKAMMGAVPRFDSLVQRRQMEIVPWTAWYSPDGSFAPQSALDAARSRITAMAEDGYSGLRASGNVGALCSEGWEDLARYEGAVDSLIGHHPAVAICSYPLSACGVRESLSVMANHRLALIKHLGMWQVVENSAQARTTAALKETRQGYRRLFENSRDGMEVIDRSTGRIAVANQAAARIFGFDTPAEMVGINPLDYLPPEDRERVAGMMSEYLFEKDMRQTMELRARKTDGSTVWLSALGTKTEYQGRAAGLISLRDVTDRKQTEQAFEDSERRYRLLAENASDVIWVTDLKFKPEYLSPSISRLLGYTVDEAMMGTPETMLTGPSLEAARDAFGRALAFVQAGPGRPPRGGRLELQLRRKDGSPVWVDTTVAFLPDANGRPMEIVGVLRDISERKKVEEELHDSLQVLERTIESAIQAIASTAETKDPYTAGHQRRVAQLACAIAAELGLPGDRIRLIRTAGLLHDLGKISLPAEILIKPGRLSGLELAVIKTHPRVAYDVLKNVESFGGIAEIIFQHHERMDGSGYPSGLRGEEILLEARILAVSDVVEAMSSHRPYRPALGLENALEEIACNSDTLYDPDVASACLRVFRLGQFKFTE